MADTTICRLSLANFYFNQVCSQLHPTIPTEIVLAEFDKLDKAVAIRDEIEIAAAGAPHETAQKVRITSISTRQVFSVVSIV